MTLADRIRDMIRGFRIQHVTDNSDRFESIVREIAREEIAKAKADDDARRRQMLEDIRAGRPVDAFVNRGDNPHGNQETQT